jgi:Nickel responsive protein SCO4226-like
MALYLVERHLPGITGEQLKAAAQAAKDTSNQMTQQGRRIRYLRSTFLPIEEKCLCLFEADTPDLVEDTNRAAGLPFDKVHEAAHIASDDLT